MKFSRYALIMTLSIGLLVSCDNDIESGDTLKKETLDLIKSLGLLDHDERIIKFYSNFEEDKAGNFFTNKRIGHYWLDSHDKSKNDTSFAYYKDILSIDTVYNVPDTYSPYMKITKSDSSEIKVYVGGEHDKIKAFFEDAIGLWHKNKSTN